MQRILGMILASAIALTLAHPASAKAAEADGSVQVGGQPFSPRFLVLSSPTDPDIELRPGSIPHVSYNVTSWKAGKNTRRLAPAQKVDTQTQVGDGFDERIQKGKQEGRTFDLFHVGGVHTAKDPKVTVEGKCVRWDFPASDQFSLSAQVELAEGNRPAVLSFEFTPKKAGWYSVGYVGAPAVDPKDMEEMWQPLVWQEKRFPDDSYLTMAFHCPIPTTLVTHKGVTMGVVADPAELPFQPLPTFANSRFGVAVRNAQGNAQPMLFAPALGGVGSHMKAGEQFKFRMHLVAMPGRCLDVYERIARETYGFRDHRRNAISSMNQTIENEIEYGLSRFSRFNDDLRGCCYETDVRGAVKNVSALHPLAMALVADDERIFATRARPIMEYLMSREKFLFVTDPNIKGQSPGWRLRGPCAPVSELASLYLIGLKRTPVFLKEAERLSKSDRVLNLDETVLAGRWQDMLWMYRATGEKTYLNRAVAGADEYVGKRVLQRQADFKDKNSHFFWTTYAPDWVELFELFEETGQKRFLDAAHEGARRYTQYTWFCPTIPDADVTVNKGGKAPQYWYLAKRGTGAMSVPEESVPAWRVSEIGLTCESSGTSAGHRGIFMANFAPWMLRIAQQTGDSFLRDVARSAIVGRSANFPGYHMNTARTTVYEKPDYPLHDHKQLTYNSFHYNHIWPHIVLLMDYLVSDASARSKGQIQFPSHYAEGYAYLKSKIYGDRAGRMYDGKDLWLWMPKGLLTIDNVQIDYIAARGKDSLWLVLMNQSPEAVNATVRINEQLVGLSGAKAARVWKENQPADAVPLAGGQVSVAVAPMGITVVALDGASPKPGLQKVYSEETAVPMGPQSFGTATGPFGKVPGIIISFGSSLTSAYVWLEATFKDVKSAKLVYTIDGQQAEMIDAAYPYEFTVPLPAGAKEFRYTVEAEKASGGVEKSESMTLEIQH